MIEQRVVLRSEADWQRLRTLFMEIKDAPLLYEVIVRELRGKRSVEQNARYWALLTEISEQKEDETKKKFSPEVWHEYFKAKFLGKDTVVVDGDIFLACHSTTNLNIIEFNDYMTQIEAWAIEHDVEFAWPS